MQLFQTGMAYGKLNLRKVAIQKLHVVPRNDALIDALAECLGNAAGCLLDPRSKTAQNAADAHFGAQQAQLRARGGKLQVVYAHNLHALRVHDLTIEHVARQQHFGRLQVAEADGGAVNLQADALFFAEAFHIFTPGDHKRRFAGT